MEKIPEFKKVDSALDDLYDGIGACKAAESTAVFISLETAEVAAAIIENYISNLEESLLEGK